MAVARKTSNVSVLVGGYGFSVVFIGYALGSSTSRAILGMMALSPAIFAVLIPFVGLVACLCYWPYVGFLLANVEDKTNQWKFMGLSLAHYAGIVLIVTWDFRKEIPAQELRDIWMTHPIGTTFFMLFYGVGQLAIWAHFRRSLLLLRAMQRTTADLQDIDHSAAKR